jgi:hypothetical protein
MLLWSSKNGPQGFPFNAFLISTLGEAIASTASVRPKKITDAAKAIISMIQGKNNMCAEMSGSHREALARSVHRLLRSGQATTDSEGVIQKLRTILTSFEALGLSDSSTAAAAAKRKLDESNEVDEDESQLIASAKAAVDALTESRMKSQKTESISTGSSLSAGAAAVVAKANAAEPPQVNVVTELSSELASYIENAGLKEVKIVTLTNAKSTSNDELMFYPCEVPDCYDELSKLTFQRALESYYNVKSYGKKVSI